MSHDRETVVVNGTMFYKSTGTSNLYNFPGIYFPTFGPDATGFYVKMGAPKLEKWHWKYRQVAESKFRFPATDFLLKFKHEEHFLISTTLSEWSKCVLTIKNDLGEFETDSDFSDVLIKMKKKV